MEIRTYNCYICNIQTWRVISNLQLIFVVWEDENKNMVQMLLTRLSTKRWEDNLLTRGADKSS